MHDGSTGPTVRHDTIRIERVFDASPARVFAAWADPAARDRWFVQGEGWDIAEYRHDFRVGGREGGRFRRVGDPIVIVNSTVYYDIVRDQRIVFAYSMGRGEVPFSVSLATVELHPAGAGTRMVFTEQIAVLDGSDSVDARRHGWGWLFDRLAAELGREPARA